MSADNQILIRRKTNGLYEVRHCSDSSLSHELAGETPSLDDLTLRIVADDVDGLDKAREIAQKFEQKIEEDGMCVEYGIKII